MKSDVFNTWFKELVSLIFVQTFQAFLLAIVMTVIVKAISTDKLVVEGGIDALGLFAIIALKSFSKFELLVKKIFGMGSQFGDPTLASGRKSLVGSMLALRGLKSTFDNGRKIFGGAGRAIKGGVGYLRSRNNLYDKEISDRLGNGDPNSSNASAFNSAGGSNPNPGNGSNSSGGLTDQKLNDLINALNNNSKSNDAKNRNNDKDLAKAEAIAGLKDMASGIAETAGAITGATTGALYGMAHGDGVAEASMTGAGIGDTIGRTAVNLTVNTKSALNTTKDAAKEVKRTWDNRKAYKAVKAALNKEDRDSIKELNEKLEKFANSKLAKNLDDVGKI